VSPVRAIFALSVAIGTGACDRQDRAAALDQRVQHLERRLEQVEGGDAQQSPGAQRAPHEVADAEQAAGSPSVPAAVESTPVGKATVLEESAFVVLLKNDSILVQDQILDEVQFERVLAEHARRSQGASLLLRVAGDVSPTRVREVVALAKQAGIGRFAVAQTER
jgi:biopolymer transport protein ExbD